MGDESGRAREETINAMREVKGETLGATLSLYVSK